LAIILLSLSVVTACSSRALLSKVSFAPETISPNADGIGDVTQIHYELNRNAKVSIYLQASDGGRHYFRQDQPRSAGIYDVLFGGVLDGQLLPNGDYTYTVAAADEAGQVQSAQGLFVINGGEVVRPQITMTVSPQEFTPNRDGIADRVKINVNVNTAATLNVTLHNSLCHGSTPPPDQPLLDCTAFPLSENPNTNEARQPGERGVHLFDYDAGVDLGAEPPPDGTYVVTARAEDQVGQTTLVTDTLTIKDGGVPRAEIVDGTVDFSAKSLLVGDTLYFTLTVDNYSSVPIRTSGPPPGYMYDLDQNFNVPGFAEESGAWRVGIDFDTSQRNYPFRWAVGGPNDLIVQEIDGQKYYYLPAGQRAVITGGIHITQKPPRDPLYFWAGLIHEDVEITAINNRVDPHFITIDQP
jgi:hypothetical protein